MPLREVFPHEAYDLTRWLSENSDVLAEATGRRITISASEDRVGSFIADLVGEDEDGNVVVVENQLSKSDHDHLGKLLTYTAGTDAKISIWIVGEPRPEHLEAITWLNQANLCAFYLFKLEAVQIGASEPAPLLTLITGPSEELVRSGETRKDQAERYTERESFWAELLPVSNARTPLFSNVSPGRFAYINTGSGRSGVQYVYRLLRSSMSVELYFGRSPDENTEYLSRFRERKQEIEHAFGEPLFWDDMPGSKACRIRYDLPQGGYRSERDDWQSIISNAVDAMVRLESATRMPLREIVLK